MSWNSPKTWATSEFADAAMMNEQIRDNETFLYAWAVGDSFIAGSTIMLLKVDSLGGTDSHRPVIGGTTYSKWHLCNGNANIDGLGYTAPDMRDYFPVGAGSTYAQDDTGGAATKDVSHAHAFGTLANDPTALVAHVHGYSKTTGGASFGHGSTAGAEPVATYAHTHTFTQNTGGATTNPTHTHVMSGSADTGGSAAQTINPPYIGAYYFLYLGA